MNILYADGFAAQLGFSVATPTPKLDDWLVLMVKSIEVAPTIYAKSNFWGTKVEFAGGSTATYAVFQLSGQMLCAGNAFDYGGRLRAKDFATKFPGKPLNASAQPLFAYITAGCAAVVQPAN